MNYIDPHIHMVSRTTDDYETLAKLLRQAGFTRVSRSEYQSSEDSNLRVDEASLVAGATYGGRHYSLFVEARP